MPQWKIIEIRKENIGDKLLEMYRRGYNLVKIIAERKETIIMGFFKSKRVFSSG